MAHTIEGQFKGDGLKVAVVMSRFNSFVSERLVEGAMDALRRHGVRDDDITIVRVPGAWEIPLAIRQVATAGRFDAAVAVGAVIRGGTPHFDYVCSESIKGTAQAMMETGFPVGLGIITTNTIEQAIERAGTKAGNKGFDAAMATLETASVLKALKEH
jgi:6,7-dimethyl-8-ribityllumazine synthase